MQTDQIYRDTRIIVDLDQIAANMRAIKEMIGDDVSVMAVVKANAYGLGSLAIAPTLMENGACYLAVATLRVKHHSDHLLAPSGETFIGYLKRAWYQD